MDTSFAYMIEYADHNALTVDEDSGIPMVEAVGLAILRGRAAYGYNYGVDEEKQFMEIMGKLKGEVTSLPAEESVAKLAGGTSTAAANALSTSSTPSFSPANTPSTTPELDALAHRHAEQLDKILQRHAVQLEQLALE